MDEIISFGLIIIGIVIYIIRNNAWDSLNAKRALKAVKRTKSEKQLAYIVDKARLPETRMAAVAKITDKVLLEKIAKHNNYELEICLKAIEQIASQFFVQFQLKNIVIESDRYEIKKAAFDKISDQWALEQVFNYASDESLQEAALSKIDSKEVLESITNRFAKSDYNRTDFCFLSFIRTIQNRKNRDSVWQILLYSARGKKLMWDILEEINDQTVLAKIVEIDTWSTDSYYNKTVLAQRLKAFQKITDQESLKQVFFKVKDISIKAAALSKITEPDFLAKIVQKTNYDSSLRCLAVEKISDRIVLKYLIENDNDAHVRYAAERSLRCAEVRALKDKKTLEEIALNDNELDIKLCAFEAIDERNTVIADAIKGLKNGALHVSQSKERQSYVQNLIKLLSSDSFAAKVFWKEAAKICAIEHVDGLGHDDGSYHSSDCNTRLSDLESNRHQDTGIGITFPPYPFSD